MLSRTLVSSLTFVAILVGVGAICSIISDLFFRDRKKIGQRVDDALRKSQREKAKKSSLFGDLSRIAVEASGRKPTRRERLETILEQAGLDLSPDRFYAAMMACGPGLGLVVGLALLNPVWGLLAGLVGLALPPIWLIIVWRRRLEMLRSQLPEAFDLMSRVIRAGQTMSQAMQAVSDEFPSPIAVEFAYAHEQQNLGLSSDLALRDLARRTGLLEMRIFVVAMIVHQQTGGNLSELLDKLSAVVRDRFRIRGMIKSLTAEGRLQAMILLALPVVLFFAMLILNPAYMRVLLETPKLIATMLVLEGIGALWIRKIVNFDF